MASWLSWSKFIEICKYIGGIAVFVVAVIGIKVYFIDSTPKFQYSSEFTYEGVLPNSGGKSRIFLSGTVLNKGTDPLIPVTFKLRICPNGKEYMCEPMRIPPDFFIGDRLNQRLFSKDNPADKDLQLIQSFEPKKPYTGYLLFVTDVGVDELLSADEPYELILYDIDGEDYTQIIKLGKMHFRGTFPKSGSTVR